jgi:hypothetical protein
LGRASSRGKLPLESLNNFFDRAAGDNGPFVKEDSPGANMPGERRIMSDQDPGLRQIRE